MDVSPILPLLIQNYRKKVIHRQKSDLFDWTYPIIPGWIDQDQLRQLINERSQKQGFR